MKYTTALFHTRKSNWNHGSVNVSKIKRLEVLDNGKYVTGRLVIKETNNADSISSILGISISKLKMLSKWIPTKHPRYCYFKGLCLFVELACQTKYYANIWDPWMMDSFKTTSYVLGKRSIPADLINMIQEFTHFKNQHTD